MSKSLSHAADAAAEIERERESLERLAASDYPIADAAEALLEIAEDTDE